MTTAVVVVPCVAAVVRALAAGRYASADRAFIAIRSLDVLSIEHHPLTGTWSSVSATTGTTVHHPGPLLFDVLAVPAQLFGPDVGVPLAVGALNALCAWWTVHLVGRSGGLAARVVAAVTISLLMWTMTWQLLVDSWNPYAAMLPALLFFVACGLLSAGEPAAAVPAVVAASLCLQAHIGHVYILFMTALVALGLWWWNRRAGLERDRPWSTRQRILPLAVFIGLWIQPLIDVFVNGSDSNVSAMWRAASASADQIGLGEATRLLASVVAVPPFWLPSGFEGLTIIEAPTSTGVSALALAIVIVVVLIVGRLDLSGRVLGRYVALLLPLAVVSIARIPLNPTYGYGAHQYRWAWPLAVLPVLVVGSGLAAAVLRHRHQIAAGLPAAVAVAACACALVVNLLGDVRPGPYAPDHRALRQLVDGLPFDELARCGRVIVDYEAGFALPALVGPSVLLALRQRDIDFAPIAEDAVLQLDRRSRGDERCRLILAGTPGPGRPIGTIEEGSSTVFVTLTRVP